jgi:hypothetical protein
VSVVDIDGAAATPPGFNCSLGRAYLDPPQHPCGPLQAFDMASKWRGGAVGQSQISAIYGNGEQRIGMYFW